MRSLWKCLLRVELDQPDTTHHAVNQVDCNLCFPYYRRVDGTIIWMRCTPVEKAHWCKEKIQTESPNLDNQTWSPLSLS